MKKQNSQGCGKARPAAKNTPASVPTTGGRPPASPAPTKARKSKANPVAADANASPLAVPRSPENALPIVAEGQYRGMPLCEIVPGDYEIPAALSLSEFEKAKRLLCLQHMSHDELKCLKRYWIMEFADLPLSKEQRMALADHDDDSGEEWKRGRGA